MAHNWGLAAPPLNCPSKASVAPPPPPRRPQVLQKAHQGQGSPARENISLLRPRLSCRVPGDPRLCLHAREEAGKPGEIAALNASWENPSRSQASCWRPGPKPSSERRGPGARPQRQGTNVLATRPPIPREERPPGSRPLARLPPGLRPCG